MLRPLRTMNTAIKRISARNVHERLALRGPRDELRNLADTVDGLLERLDSAFDAQKRFVANAAHELRTPLTLEHALLEESLLHRDSDTSSMRSIMGRLLDLSEQQGRLLESLLTLAKSEGGLDHRGPLDLAEIAERMVKTAEGMSPRVDRGNPRAGEGETPGAGCSHPPIGDRDRARPNGGRPGTGRTAHRQPAGQRRALQRFPAAGWRSTGSRATKPSSPRPGR